MNDPDFSQRAVLGAVLSAHPRMLDLEELGSQLPGVEHADQAVAVLVGDGLVRRLGDLIGATRAAVRYEALAAGSGR